MTLDCFAGGKANVQYADLVLALERDQQDDDEKDQTNLRILKERLTGEATGLCIPLEYNPETGRKLEVEQFKVTPPATEGGDPEF